MSGISNVCYCIPPPTGYVVACMHIVNFTIRPSYVIRHLERPYSAWQHCGGRVYIAAPPMTRGRDPSIPEIFWTSYTVWETTTKFCIEENFWQHRPHPLPFNGQSFCDTNAGARCVFRIANFLVSALWLTASNRGARVAIAKYASNAKMP